MLLSKKVTLIAIAVCISLLVATTYASRFQHSAALPLGIEIALAKPFYIPAATSSRKMSAVVRPLAAEEYSGHEIAAVKLSPVMEGNKVKVTVYALIGDESDIENVKSCKDWDSFESVTVGTYVAGLDEEVSVTKLRNFGVNFETGDLKFRIVPKKTFQQMDIPLGSDDSGDCGCASCGTLQCCPNPGYCIGCGVCGRACCNAGG